MPAICSDSKSESLIASLNSAITCFNLSSTTDPFPASPVSVSSKVAHGNSFPLAQFNPLSHRADDVFRTCSYYVTRRKHQSVMWASEKHPHKNEGRINHCRVFISPTKLAAAGLASDPRHFGNPSETRVGGRVLLQVRNSSITGSCESYHRIRPYLENQIRIVGWQAPGSPLTPRWRTSCGQPT